MQVYLGLHGLGNIIQSKFVTMMSLAVVGTLTNQILLVSVGLHGGLRRSMQVYTGLHEGLQGSTWGSMPIATIDLVGDNRDFEV